jgi:lipocalin
VIEISAKEARSFLKNCERRVTQDGFEVFYNGKWLELGRTDELDDIQTTICDAKFSEYKPRFGARIAANGFFAIDSISDG